MVVEMGPRLRETLSVFDTTAGVGEPLTTTEVSAELDCTRRAAYDRLDELAGRGAIETKKVGARGRIWWRPPNGPTEPTVAVPGLSRELVEVFERIDDGFVAVDTDRRLTYVNERATDLLRRTREDLIDERIDDILKVVGESETSPAFDRVAGTHGPSVCERYVDELDRWFALSIYPSDRGLSVYFRDITDRKRRQGDLERYEAAVETIGDGVYVVDDENRFRLVNDAHARLTGYDRSELLGAHASLVTSPADLSLADRHLEHLVAGGDEVTTVETELVTKAGRRVPVETRFARFPLGDDRHGRVGVVRDITDRRERERELEARIRQQTAVTELGQRALESHDLDDLLAHASRVVAETLDADYCKVLDLDEGAGELSLRQGVGWHDGVVGTAIVSATDDDSQAAHTLRTERPVVVEDLRTETRFSGPDLLTDHGVVSGISVVVGSLDDPWGILGTHDTTRRVFSEHDVNFVQSVAHTLATAVDRDDRDRDLERYEIIVESIEDGVYVLDEGYCFTDVNDAYAEMMGYDRETLIGSNCSLVVGDEVSREAAAGSQSLVDRGGHATLETEITRPDGSRFYAESKFTPLPAWHAHGDETDHAFGGTVGVVRDTTERREREREIERRRAQLAVLDDLNEVIRGIADAVIAQSTRVEVQRVVCDRLAASGAYHSAWLGELDRTADALRITTTANCDSLRGVELPVEGPCGAMGELVQETLRTRAVQVRRWDDDAGVGDDDAGAGDDTTAGSTDDETLTEVVLTPQADTESGATVCLPVVHDGVLFGILALSTDRPHGFDPDERAPIEHLGEVVGHAIASIERKRALMSDEVVELQYRTRDLSEAFGVSPPVCGTITVEQVVAISDSRYLVFGSVTDDAVETLRAFFEAAPTWEELTFHDDGEHRRFELVLTEEPVTSAAAAQGGQMVEARIVDGVLHLSFHLPPGGDVRALTDVVESAYPGTELVARRQLTRTQPRLRDTLTEALTERQRAALEASFRAGFFEWPRVRSGEEVAESLGVTPPTFHQHLRAAERKVFTSLLS